MDLKFFYVVEFNLEHPSITALPIADEFKNHTWVTLTSESFDTDEKCINHCMKLMKAKARDFNSSGKKVKVKYAENPQLSCDMEDIDSVDLGEFDENSLAMITVEEAKPPVNEEPQWLIRSSIMLYGIDDSDNGIDRNLH